MDLSEKSVRIATSLVWLIAVIFILVLYFKIDLSEQLIDGFHEGEYLANRFYFSGVWINPVMIHGLMDVIPYNMGTFLLGTDSALAGTRLANELIGAVSGLLFVGILATLMRDRIRAIVVFPVGLIVLAYVNLGNTTAVLMQQGFPGVRDVFVMLVLWLLALSLRRGKSAHVVITALCGFICGLTLFWAYNRGIAAAFSVGCYAFFLIVMERSVRKAAPLIIGLLTGLAVNFIVSPSMFLTHLNNMIYWQANQYIWHSITLNNWLLLIGVVVLGATAGAGLTGLYGTFRAIRTREPAPYAAVLLALVAAAGLASVSSLNRLDLAHIFMVVPYATLAAVAAFQVIANLTFPAWMLPENWPRIAVVASMIVLVALLGLQTWHSRAALSANLTGLAYGFPEDRDLATDYLQVADFIAKGGGSCTYVLDNQGVFYHLSGLRPCSRFLIPIYAGRDAEAALLSDLQQNQPEVLMMRSTFWSYDIDGINQAQRTPLVHSWAKENYSPTETFDGYEMMVRNKN